MSKFGKDLIRNLTEVLEVTQGKREAARVTTVYVTDVRHLRRHLKMSQRAFSDAYKIPLPTLKNWEQGRRHPDAPAAAYLAAIARKPREIRDAFK